MTDLCSTCRVIKTKSIRQDGNHYKQLNTFQATPKLEMDTRSQFPLFPGFSILHCSFIILRALSVCTCCCCCRSSFLCGELDGARLFVDALDKGAGVDAALVVLLLVVVGGGGVVVVVVVVVLVALGGALFGGIAGAGSVTNGAASVASVASVGAGVRASSSIGSSSIGSSSVRSSGIRSSAVVGASLLDHLNRHDAAKGTSTSRVLAPDQADVVLASDLTCALLAGGNGSGERVVGGAAGVVAAALVAVDVLGDLDVLPVLGGAVRVDHAGVGPGAVAVDLVQRHLEVAAGRDLRELAAHLGHDGLRARLDVVAAGAHRLAHRLGRRAAEPRGVLLEGVAARAVTGGRRVDAQRPADAACVADGVGDGCVARDELGREEGRGGEDGLEGHVVGELLSWVVAGEVLKVIFFARRADRQEMSKD